jgi:hypothetical protein
LIVDSIPQVLVSKSAHSFASSQSVETLPQAKVILFENNITVDTLSYSIDGYNPMGIFKGDYRIKAHKAYKIQASHSNFGIAYGETVCPSNLISITDVDVSGVRTETVAEGEYELQYRRTGKLKLKLTHPSSSNYHYFLSITDQGGEIKDGFEITSRDFIVSKEAYKETRDLDGAVYYKSNLYFSGASFNSTTTLTIEINPGDDTWEYESDPTDDLVVKLEVLNHDDYQFSRKMEEYEDGQYNPFAEMIFLYDNIQGGYGIVGAKVKYEKIAN